MSEAQLVSSRSGYSELVEENARLAAEVRALRNQLDAVQEHENIFEPIVKSLCIGVVVANVQGRLTYMNPAAMAMCGRGLDVGPSEGWVEFYDVYELDGKTPFPSDDLPLLRALAGEVVEDVHMVVRNPELGDRIVSITAIPIQNGGSSAGAMLMTVDVTDAVQRRRELECVTGALERSNRDLEQFVAIASHDLREPLRMVSSYVALLKRKYEDRIDERADRYIRYACEGTARMDRLIDDLRTYSRLDAADSIPQPVDLNSLIATALKNLEVAIRDAEASIEVEPLPVVRGEETLLAQACENLIGNALKFRGNQPANIRIRAKRHEDAWVLCFHDDGVGFDPRYCDQIFGVFQRLAGAKSLSGSGIGLAIVKRIAERHHGKVWAESTPGEGSTFFFSVPDVRQCCGTEGM